MDGAPRLVVVLSFEKQILHFARHTYATLRLQEGVDVYFLAEQMGTSVHMIEQHYGHVNTIKHADRVLQGMAGWELPQPDDTKAKASKAAETHDKGKRSQSHRPR